MPQSKNITKGIWHLRKYKNGFQLYFPGGGETSSPLSLD